MRTSSSTRTMRQIGACAVVAAAIASGSIVHRTTAAADDTRPAGDEQAVGADNGSGAPASIGNRVWWDLDADGVQDAAEPGLAGVRVDVTDLGADGAIGGGDDVAHTVSTDADGNYVAENLPAGTFRVSVQAADLPVGFVPTYDLDGGVISADALWIGPLDAGAARRDVDFGYAGSASIGAVIWFDQDADGVRDLGEPGIADVTVAVTWAGADGVAGGTDDRSFVTTTDTDGQYVVHDLPAGVFTVVENAGSLPPGFTRQTTDPDGALDSVSTVTLTAGETNQVQGFAYAGTGSIGDAVWFDRDGDGTRDANDDGIPGSIVALTWSGPDGVAGGDDDAVFTRPTIAAGRYSFDNLPAGNFVVQVDGLPPDYVNTSDEDGDVDSGVAITLAVAQHHLSADFGYRGSTAVGDRVWWDVDADGVQDQGEPGLAGVEVTLRYAGPDTVVGSADDIGFVRTTDGAGRYLVSNTPEGTYTVAVTAGVPAGLAPTYDEDSGTAGVDQTVDFALGAGAHATADFGYAGSGSIGDLVFLDNDGDGMFGIGDRGLPGVGVALHWSGRDASFDTTDDVAFDTVTDSAGQYSFKGLPAGDFRVAVDGDDLPPGLISTADPDGDADDSSRVHVGAGRADVTQDFGYRGTGSIGDLVWLDLDGNGAADAGEPGLAMVDVGVTWAGVDGRFGTADDVVSTDVTDADGHYLVDHLPSGAYRVAVDSTDTAGDVLPTADPDGGADNGSSLNLSAGVARLEQDFGYRGDASVGNRVWIDVDADGVQDRDEPGYAGLAITVLAAGLDGVFGSPDDIVVQTVTSSSGAFEVNGLPIGNARVSYVRGTLSKGYAPGSDTDGADRTTTQTSLTGGATAELRFGIRGTATLSDMVWNDTDGDGVRDADEVGVAGVTVEASWTGPFGRVVLRSVTGPDGSYKFTSLPPGSYTVTTAAATVPSGLVPATRDGVASFVPPGGAATARLSQVQSASIGDLVWLDTDRDGRRDADEIGLGGITVRLVDQRGTIVATTGTDRDGRYVFTGLLPEAYRVVVDLNTVPAGHRQYHDPDAVLDGMSSVKAHPGNVIMAEDFSFGPISLPPITGHEPWRNLALGLSIVGGLGGGVALWRRRPHTR